MDWLSIGYGAIGGLGWSLLRIGYHKADPSEKAEVEVARIVKTVLVGVAIGAFAGLRGEVVSADMLEALSTTALSSAAFTGILDTVVNLAIRLWKRYA